MRIDLSVSFVCKGRINVCMHINVEKSIFFHLNVCILCWCGTLLQFEVFCGDDNLESDQ